MNEIVKLIEEYLTEKVLREKEAFNNLVTEVTELKKRMVDLEDDVNKLKSDK